MSVRLKREQIHKQSVISYTVCNLTGTGWLWEKKQRHAIDHPGCWLNSQGRWHKYTQIHRCTQCNTKHKHTHTEGDTNTWNYTNTQTNRQQTIQQGRWWQLRGATSNGGQLEGAGWAMVATRSRAGNALDETHVHRTQGMCCHTLLVDFGSP